MATATMTHAKAEKLVKSLQSQEEKARNRVEDAKMKLTGIRDRLKGAKAEEKELRASKTNGAAPRRGPSAKNTPVPSANSGGSSDDDAGGDEYC